MTCSTRCFADEGSGAADEGSVPRGSDNHESFATFDSGRSITSIAFVLIDGKRFSSNGRLIDLDESVLGDDTTVGGNNGSFFDLDNITRNDFRSLYFDEGTVSKSDGFKCKSLFQLFDN